MTSDLITVVAVLAGVVALSRVRDLGPRADPGRRAVAIAVLGVAAGATLLSPEVARRIELASGVANVGEPLARSALMVAALGAQAIFLLAAPGHGSGHRVRRRVVGLAVALAAFWTAFAAAPRYPPRVPTTSTTVRTPGWPRCWSSPWASAAGRSST